MSIKLYASVRDIPRSSWQACFPGRYPFLQYDFLAAMEAGGCTTRETGWQPRHILGHGSVQGGGAEIALPLYLKSHSWGEYVFDQEWAHAYQHHGLRYYPKLLTAAPFTPATGPRWGGSGGDQGLSPLVDAVKEMVAEGVASSWHCLFPEASQADSLEALGLLRRSGCQFHWFNRGYDCFDDFLSTFASRKRKNTRKERQAVQSLGLTFQRQSGETLSEADWARFYQFYADTYYKRGHSPHLSPAFFPLIGRSLGEQILVDWVWLPGEDTPVAAALFFYDDTTLYGRYWGCRREIDGLHFEVCFYRGIEFAIEKGLQRFDPGAQGEHKISRGFEPVETWSCHWIGHPAFRDAVARFLQEEKRYLDEYRQLAAERLPFRRG
ncbi:MAG: GNAT family N-acetyltransferase [Ketobacteraceae bacterium]|nr:GNAT family N-acetyltransferase [Ketobacteraceae bacterium]